MFYKRLYFIYLIIFGLCTSLSFSQGSKFTVVLDAGHGGKDPGAVQNGLYEKNIALDVTLRVGKILEEDSKIKTVYTRKTDVFIPLKERASIANKNNANLFVSIHCNSIGTPSVSGTLTLVMGMSRTDTNLEIAKRENAVIFQEENYQENYKGFDPNNPETLIGLKIIQEENILRSIDLAGYIQNNFKTDAKRKDKGVHQQPIWVLDATVMPSVLVELGFISNPEEAKYLNSETGKQDLANAIAKAIITYKKEYLAEIAGSIQEEPATIKKETVKEAKTETDKEITDVINSKATNEKPQTIKENDAPVALSITKEITEVFMVQISAGKNKIELKPSNFKGLKNVTVKLENGTYKYFYGNETTLDACKKLVQEAKSKGFSGAFVVSYNSKTGEKTTY